MTVIGEARIARAGWAAGASLLALAIAGAAQAQDAKGATEVSELVITAARTTLPASALPMTVDVVDSEDLAQQVSISGSIVDAVSSLSPSFSPTRQKLSGSGETLRGRSPLYAINGIPQSTPIRDGSRDGYTIDHAAMYGFTIAGHGVNFRLTPERIASLRRGEDIGVPNWRLGE